MAKEWGEMGVRDRERGFGSNEEIWGKKGQFGTKSSDQFGCMGGNGDLGANKREIGVK